MTTLTDQEAAAYCALHGFELFLDTGDSTYLLRRQDAYSTWVYDTAEGDLVRELTTAVLMTEMKSKRGWYPFTQLGLDLRDRLRRIDPC